jgi:competence protein ComEA
VRLLSFLFALGTAAIAFAAEPPQRIDINNASQEAIETLPGVGPAIAQEIIKGRPYRTFADLDKVKGIGPKKLDQLRGRVVIAPMRAQLPSAQVRSSTTNQIAAKVNLNTATQAELEKLPGIGPKRAEAIIAARPFKQIDDLQKVKGLTRAQLNELKTQVVVR